MKRELPILFSTPMVQAIKAGRKTQTRRMVPYINLQEGWRLKCERQDAYVFERLTMLGGPASTFAVPPKYQIGDFLYVRESWAEYYDPHGDPFTPLFVYKADGVAKPQQWKPSIHMPKTAARIWLEVTAVRAERLQDITIEDIIHEGLSTTLREHDACCDLREQWEQLWQSINGPESWELNPWVWVISFKVLSTDGRPIVKPEVPIY